MVQACAVFIHDGQLLRVSLIAVWSNNGLYILGYSSDDLRTIRTTEA